MLRRPGHLRRAAGRRPARHRPLRVRLRKPLPRGRDRALRRRICRGPHADPVRVVQPGREVHRSDRLRPRAWRRLPRDRPLCPARRHGDRAELHKGADPARDQSYFLYATTREQLDFLRFPLGDLPKDEVRRIAARARRSRSPPSPTARTSASSPTAIMRGWSSAAARGRGAGRDRRPRRPGAWTHRGVIHFTVGQRRGIEIGGQTEPLYVRPDRAGAARVVVGPRRALAVEAMRVARLELARRGAAPDRREGALAGAAVPATRDGEWVRFGRPEYGVAPGQAAVLYEGARVLGGGRSSRPNRRRWKPRPQPELKVGQSRGSGYVECMMN